LGVLALDLGPPQERDNLVDAVQFSAAERQDLIGLLTRLLAHARGA
jgi:hypothetical protein